MAALDTNVLVRLLVRDDAVQVAQAQERIEQALSESVPLFVPITVVLELEWVLRARYAYTKQQVLAALVALLEVREFEWQDEPAVEHALHLYRQHRADFAECLHLGSAAAAGTVPLLTFDRGAARLPDVEVIGAGSR
jgi:predicted nucleic-acid-binding protein